MSLFHPALAWELWRWRRAGRQARLWWRDDDARQPGAALDILLSLAAKHDAPLTLAVTPDGDCRVLAERLSRQAGVTVIQHGADHIDRSGGTGGACEFPADWTGARIEAALAAGRVQLAVLPGWTPVFAPPWNAVHADLPQALARGGYLGWSAWDDKLGGEGPARIDAHLDILRWKGGARFRGTGRILGRLARLLRRRRLSGQWEAPVGLLTHHLDHDTAAWVFLGRFMTFIDDEAALAWVDLPALLAASRLARAA